MRVQIYDTYEEMSRAAADLVAAQLLQKPNCHLGLTAGSTPVGLCAELVKLYKDHRVSFSECTLYNLEEMADVPPEDPTALRNSFFHAHLLDFVDAEAHVVHSRKGNPICAMGVRHILLSKRIIMIANGEAKADAVAAMCHGPVTTLAPASLLQLHPDVVVLLDKPAASKL